ncbi:MAG TPA: hypothetical protein PLV92_02575 [Pirellulaceae bacterium]|nr:hypothetical protein [Pirellulaceae bacterium]
MLISHASSVAGFQLWYQRHSITQSVVFNDDDSERTAPKVNGSPYWKVLAKFRHIPDSISEVSSHLFRWHDQDSTSESSFEHRVKDLVDCSMA